MKARCLDCKIIKRKIVPFLSIEAVDLDLKNIQKNIDSNIAKGRICNSCKKKCKFDTVLNNVVVIDVEPSLRNQNQKIVSLQNLTQTIKLGKEYKLCAAIEFDSYRVHFISHVKRNGEWIIYDDLKSRGIKSHEKTEILPFMLFYVTECNDDTFKKALIDKPFIKEVIFFIILEISRNSTHRNNISADFN